MVGDLCLRAVTRTMKSALANLVGRFSDEQQKAADEPLAPQMGIMPMMQGVQMGVPTQVR